MIRYLYILLPWPRAQCYYSKLETFIYTGYLYLGSMNSYHFCICCWRRFNPSPDILGATIAIVDFAIKIINDAISLYPR